MDPTSASPAPLLLFFFFNDTATTEIYTLSLHDALPIFLGREAVGERQHPHALLQFDPLGPAAEQRSEEHTSELQSRPHLVCRLLLEKKNSAHGIAGSRKNQCTALVSTRSVCQPTNCSTT